MEWVLVPKVPTRQMLDAMMKTMPKKRDDFQMTSNEVKHRRRWQAAINSAPQPTDGAVSIPHPYYN